MAAGRKETKMKKIIKIIKIVLVVALLLLGLGYCGQMDSEYEAERTMMAEKQPRKMMQP